MQSNELKSDKNYVIGLIRRRPIRLAYAFKTEINSENNLQTDHTLELEIFTAEFAEFINNFYHEFTFFYWFFLSLSLFSCASLSLSFGWGRTQDRRSPRKCNEHASCLRFLQRALDPTNQCRLGLREGEMLLGVYANCFAQALGVPEPDSSYTSAIRHS